LRSGGKPAPESRIPSGSKEVAKTLDKQRVEPLLRLDACLPRKHQRRAAHPQHAPKRMAVSVPESRGSDSEVPAPGAAAGKVPETAGRVTVLELPRGFSEPPEQAFVLKDALHLAMLPVLAAVAWSCSDSLCLRLARTVTRLLRRLQPGRYRDYDGIFRDFHPATSRSDAGDDRSVEAAALQHLERLQLLRYHRPGSWQPRIEVAGKDNLERALAQGKGAILWVTSAIFSDTISKAALCAQGYRVWHLSRHSHGHFSTTRFGIRFLNPIRLAVECRYLAARVVIDPAESKAAMARLEQLLGDNHVVSITVDFTARRATLAPFGPGRLPLAGGAPNLAAKSGAALLPVFTERRSDGSFLVTIEPSLEAPPEFSHERKIAHMIASEAALLYRHFVRLPTQFLYPRLHYGRRLCEALAAGQVDARPPTP